MLRTVEMDLDFLPYLQEPPIGSAQLQQKAVSNDEMTINAWRDIWIENTKKNHKAHGPFKKSHVGQFFGQLEQKPCIVLGSGPSLEHSIKALQTNKDIYVVSCLHNFHYLMDHGIKVDLWVSLDAGPITIEEISEGGKKSHDFYLNATKNQKLALFIASDPGLVKSWKGEKFWFAAPIPDKSIRDEIAKIEPFEIYLSNGGNVLGAALYIARAFMGANPICFGGADFAFGYKKNFHPWPSKYDGKLGKTLLAHDIFGNKCHTWSSYNNFKSWTESVTMRCPGIFYNGSEGGTLGSYATGLIPSIRQIAMIDFIEMYRIHENIRYMAEHPECAKEPNKPGPIVLF